MSEKRFISVCVSRERAMDAVIRLLAGSTRIDFDTADLIVDMAKKFDAYVTGTPPSPVKAKPPSRSKKG